MSCNNLACVGMIQPLASSMAIMSSIERKVFHATQCGVIILQAGTRAFHGMAISWLDHEALDPETTRRRGVVWPKYRRPEAKNEAKKRHLDYSVRPTPVFTMPEKARISSRDLQHHDQSTRREYARLAHNSPFLKL